METTHNKLNKKILKKNGNRDLLDIHDRVDVSACWAHWATILTDGPHQNLRALAEPEIFSWG